MSLSGFQVMIIKIPFATSISFLSKHLFEGEKISDFANTNWRNILNQTGYWQRGNYLVVEFDGKGQFRFLRGNQDKIKWLSLR